MIDSARETSNKYQIEDSVIINSQEWIIAKEFNGNVLLFRNSIDEHSRTMKFSKKDLQEKDEFDLNQQINRLALNL